MNRIAGILNLNYSPVRLIDIKRMVDSLRHHKSNPQKIWIGGEIGLGVVHLKDPTVLSCNQINSEFGEQNEVIVFDGRLDNRKELLEILKPNLENESSACLDEEIVLAAYKKWGENCPKYLIGDFSFSIWDKSNHRLICARDHFGVKPLYYYLSREFFAFASSPDAILASGRISPELNEIRLADHLVNPLDGADKTSTFYLNIFRLPPAHVLILQEREMCLRSYWEVSPVVSSEYGTESDCVKWFRQLFFEAVACRLTGPSPQAVMLSGGLDSSSVTAIGRAITNEKSNPPLQVFAVISNLLKTNRDTIHIDSILGQGGLRSCLISENELSGILDDLIRAVEDESEPFDCLMNLHRAVYRHTRDQNYRILLDGADGDSLLSGAGHLVELWHQGAFRPLFGETIRADGLTSEYKLGRELLYNSLVSFLWAYVPGRLRKRWREHRYQMFAGSAARESLIDRDFAVRVSLGERMALLDSHSPSPRSRTQVEFHKGALEHPFLTVGLESYERVASSFGIEARHPLLDVRLVEFCLGLPWQLKTYRGWTKMILRRAMEPYLPPEVAWRKDKDSLMWEVNRLILKHRADDFHQATLDEREALKPYINLPKLEKLWQGYLIRGDESQAEQLWLGVALAFWLRRHRNLIANIQGTSVS